tara:strand:- start:568 stop:759 length:192 start_codon:yes stop_codon:yes gene_type:complete
MSMPLLPEVTALKPLTRTLFLAIIIDHPVRYMHFPVLLPQYCLNYALTVARLVQIYAITKECL